MRVYRVKTWTYIDVGGRNIVIDCQWLDSSTDLRP